LTAGNQPALLGCLDAVGQADHAGAGTDGLEQRQAQFYPAGGELVQIESLAVKQMQEAVVSLRTQAENPDIAGNPGQIKPTTEANQGQDPPQESARSLASRPQGSNSVHPGNPKSHVGNLGCI
jgi:hypothetical protein